MSGIATSENANKNSIKEKVCKSEITEKYLLNPNDSNKSELTITILDIIAQNWTNVPIFNLTSLILKEGIHVFCKE